LVTITVGVLASAAELNKSDPKDRKNARKNLKPLVLIISLLIGVSGMDSYTIILEYINKGRHGLSHASRLRYFV
jgi:hypothetical protein